MAKSKGKITIGVQSKGRNTIAPLHIYSNLCVQDYMEMQRNLFMDLLAHERNRYRRILSADIKYYLSHITKKIYTVEFVSLRRRALRDCVNFTNFAFYIKCHFNVGI